MDDKLDYKIIDENKNIVEVKCSMCGSWSKRKFTEERLCELMGICESGYDEQFEPPLKSFVCLDCFQKLIKDKDDVRND